ncbi:MAG: hypothetical protein R6W96_02720 [Clostridia bacterium]
MHVLTSSSRRALESYYRKLADTHARREEARRKEIHNLEEWESFKRDRLERIREAFPREMQQKNRTIDVKVVSSHEFPGFRVENVYFESFRGWFVNATVYLPPKKGRYPGIVCPTGHSAKTFPNYVRSNQILAKNGFITVSFDPPGMKGEHQGGNDHFDDGALGFLSGFWSNAFFVYDAIRCLDYLETRKDVCTENGFGITGVSGGGHTSLYASLLDDRITALAPVCCISDNRKVTFKDFYTLCPETLAPGFLREGLDNKAFIELSAPKPCLVVAGRQDEVFDHKLAEKTIGKAKRAYGFYGRKDHLGFFLDEEAGHEYNAKMASRVAEFFNLHLKKTALAGKEGEPLFFPPSKSLLCHPPDTASMFSVNLEKLQNIPTVPDPEKLVETFCLTKEDLHVFDFHKEIRWVHSLTKRVYGYPDGYKVPALVLERVSEPSKELLVFCDDKGKWSGLENNGFLTRAAGFLSREQMTGEKTVISLDLSGFGELEPEPSAYDLADWNKKARVLSYASILLGDSILGKRARELYAILAHARDKEGHGKMTVGGRGKAALAVLVACFVHGDIDEVVLMDMPVGFASVAAHVPSIYLPDIVFHDAPGTFDIPALVNGIKNVVLVNPRLGSGEHASLHDCSGFAPHCRILRCGEKEYDFLK